MQAYFSEVVRLALLANHDILILAWNSLPVVMQVSVGPCPCPAALQAIVLPFASGEKETIIKSAALLTVIKHAQAQA